MSGATQIAAALFALVGFVLMTRGLLMPKRYHKRRPRHLIGGAVCMAGAGVLLWIGSGGSLVA